MKQMKLNSAQIVRFLVLTAILAVTTAVNYLHLHGGVIFPSVHAFCPLGGLENLWAWIGGKANLQKLFSGTMTLFFLTVVFAALFNRVFCGLLCPFGFLQELFGKISKKKFVIPVKVDYYLRYLKYGVLVFITVMAWYTATLWISPFDPYTAFAHIWSGVELLAENGIGFAVLLVVLFFSIFIDRFYCKYLCPAGALYGIIGKISPARIRCECCSEEGENTCKSCANCNLCLKNCPMNIQVNKSAKVTSAECIMCGKCVSACPQKEIGFFVARKKIKPVLFIVLIVGLFFASLAVLNAAGLMRLTVPTVEQVKESGIHLKIADLRGSMTIEQGAFYTGMELSDFYEIMQIPSQIPPDTQMKYISNYVQGYDFHVIKGKF